jgi:hypothetical protein
MSMSLPTQGICNQIRLAWVVMNLQVIVLDEFQPTTLPNVYVFIGKDILQAFVVYVDQALGSHYIVSPNLKGVYDRGQF